MSVKHLLTGPCLPTGGAVVSGAGLLTEPCLLVSLNFYGQAEVRQLHGRTLGLAG